MPSREENIQKNISRVVSKIASPQPQESKGKSPEASIGGGPKSFFGGNYDVYSTLDSIEFQGALGDASMRGNVAYIKVWKRGGTAAQTNSGAQTQDPGANDTLSVLDRDIEARFGLERENLPDGAVIIYNNDTLSYTVESADIERDGDGAIVSGFAETFFVPPLSSERQQALGTQTPTSSTTPPSSVNALRESLQYQPLANNASIGAVRSANASGFTNTLLRTAGAAIGLRLKPPYTGSANAPKSNVSSAPTGEMMWQFLFNPSELELEAGPEFKGAETWGVSDKANSGQPLHWSHNKNAQLKFNSVLLNGFVFGRKVEALEQGLLELFMSRDGEGQHGPHVLEFVWGKRAFGPCVIKNINIKEKMWDEGEVVNAELSFTLEQVPEWTINDGAYVDIARPGRQPLVAEAAKPATTAPAPAAPAAPAAADGATSGQKGKAKEPVNTQNSPYDVTKCRRVQSDIDFVVGLSREFKGKVALQPRFSVGGTSYIPRYPKVREDYVKNILQKYGNSPTYKPFFTNKYIVEQCLKPITAPSFNNELRGKKNDPAIYKVDKRFVEQLAACADSMGSGRGPIQALYINKGCQKFQGNPFSAGERL